MKIFFYRIISMTLCFSLTFGQALAMNLDDDPRLDARTEGSQMYALATLRDDTYGFRNETNLDKIGQPIYDLGATTYAQNPLVAGGNYELPVVDLKEIYYDSRTTNLRDDTYGTILMDYESTKETNLDSIHIQPIYALGATYDQNPLVEGGNYELPVVAALNHEAYYDVSAAPEFYAILGDGDTTIKVNLNWDNRVYTTGATNPLLNEYREILIALETAKSPRWANYEAFLGRLSSLLTQRVWPSGRSIPLEDQRTLKNLYALKAFLEGTLETFSTEIKLSAIALIGYHIASNAPSSAIGQVFTGGNIRTIYGIPEFPGQQAILAFFALPPLRGLWRAYFDAQLGMKETSEQYRKQALSILENTPPNWYHDFVREAFFSPPIHNMLKRLAQILIWDNRLTQQEAFQILTQIHSFAKSHNTFSWMSAMNAFYNIAHGLSVRDFNLLNKTSQENILNRKVQALEYLYEAQKRTKSNSFRRLYIRYLLYKLGLSKSKKETVFWTALRGGKASFYVFLAQGILKAFTDIARSSGASSSHGSPLAAGSGLGNVSTTQLPFTFPPITNASIPVSNTSTPATPVVTPPPTTLTPPPPAGTNASIPTTPGTLPPGTNASTPVTTIVTPPPTTFTPPPPEINASTLATTLVTPPPTLPPSTIPTPPPPPPTTPFLTVSTPGTSQPTTAANPAVPNSAAQLQCFNALIQAFNTFPGEGPANLIAGFSAFSNLPSQIDLDLSGKGLSGQTIAAILKGLNATQPNVKFRSVNLSGNFMANNAALQQVLLALPAYLQSLIWELDYTFTGSIPTDSFNYTNFGRFSNLTALDLGGWYIGGDPSALPTLISALSFLTRLNYVNMSSTHLGDDDSSSLITALFNCPNLKTSILSNNILGTKLQNIIALKNGVQNCPTLQTLILDNNRLGYNEFNASAAFLQSLSKTNITHLDLYNNNLGSVNSTTGQTHAGVLSTSLPKSLVTANFSGNSLSSRQNSADFSYLAANLTQLSNLQSLYIARQSRNAPPLPTNFTDALRTFWTNHSLPVNATDLFALLSPTDVTAFFTALPANTTVLDLSSKLTPNVLQDVATAILNLPNKANITEVDLSGNNNVGPDLVIRFLPSSFSQIFAPAIETLTNLRKIHLENNAIFSLADQTLWGNVFKNCSLLTNVFLQGNFFGASGFSGLGGAFNKTLSLTTLNLGSNPYLVRSPVPLSSIGPAFSSLKNFTTLLLSRAGIYGLSNSLPGTGADLLGFFTNLQSARNLTKFDGSYNSIGNFNVSDGVYVANTLRVLNISDFDISYNPIDLLGPQGAEAIVSAILNRVAQGSLKKFNLAGSMTLSPIFWSANQATFRNITTPLLLGACPSVLYTALLNATNSSGGTHQRRSLSESEAPRNPVAVPHVTLSADNIPVDDALFAELASGGITFEDGDDMHDPEGHPSLNHPQEESLDPDFVTSGASSVKPPFQALASFVGSIMGNALQYLRGAPPALESSWIKAPDATPLPKFISASNASDPEIAPSAHKIPLNGTSSEKASSDGPKKSSFQRPDPVITEPYVSQAWHQVEGGITLGLFGYSLLEQWAEWMLQVPEKITDYVPFGQELQKELNTFLNKTERTLWALRDSDEKSSSAFRETAFQSLKEELSTLSKAFTVSAARLKKFERNLSQFNRSLETESDSSSNLRPFNKIHTRIENLFRGISGTLEFLQAVKKMPQDEFKTYQRHLEKCSESLLNLESLPTPKERKERLREIEEILDVLSMYLKTQNTLVNLSATLESPKAGKQILPGHFEIQLKSLERQSRTLFNLWSLSNLALIKENLTEINERIDVFSRKYSVKIPGLYTPKYESFSNFVPFHKTRTRIENTLENISATLASLKDEKKLSQWHFETHQNALENHREMLRASKKISNPQERQARLTKITESLHFFSTCIEDKFGTKILIVQSPFASFYEARLWVRHSLENISDTLQSLRDQNRMLEREFNVHQDYIEKGRDLLLKLEVVTDAQKRQSRLRHLKSSLEEFSKYLKDTYHVKTPGAYSLKTVHGLNVPEEGLRNLFTEPGIREIEPSVFDQNRLSNVPAYLL